MNDPDASTATKPTEVRLCMCCLEPICADHPERPKSPQSVNGITTWVKVGAAPWVRCDRPHRVRLWSDPVGSPWNLTDLIGFLTFCEVYEIEDGDWPEVPTVLDDHHYRAALPTAIKVAVTRYAAQAVGETR